MELADLDDIFGSESIFVGKPKLGLEVTELTAEEIVALNAEENDTPMKTPMLQKLRGTHHKLAQMLAKGMRNIDAALFLGFSESRISILKNDPAFKALIEHYQEVENAAFRDFAEKMGDVGADALEIVHERMLENPDKIDTNTLLEIVKTTADRTGYGKQVKIDSRSMVLTPEVLERMKTRNVENVSKITQTDRSTAISQISGQTTSGNSGSEESSRDESSGESLREESLEGVTSETPRDGSGTSLD